ncbi:hypothetical protein P7K49_033498 [Saguinus oedipus]|uniref:Uncharacterized protein n=1 Tax=Saguinus oedipus TaxID=9490 RepID=A0ABQ9TSI0_SAGOE|nr:hypothetical protein P7K49_033498 [Saguinus oedipus]
MSASAVYVLDLKGKVTDCRDPCYQAQGPGALASVEDPEVGPQPAREPGRASRGCATLGRGGEAWRELGALKPVPPSQGVAASVYRALSLSRNFSTFIVILTYKGARQVATWPDLCGSNKNRSNNPVDGGGGYKRPPGTGGLDGDQVRWKRGIARDTRGSLLGLPSQKS